MIRTLIAILFVGSVFLAGIKFLDLENSMESAHLDWLPLNLLPMRMLVGLMIITGLILAVYPSKK